MRGELGADASSGTGIQDAVAEKEVGSFPWRRGPDSTFEEARRKINGVPEHLFKNPYVIHFPSAHLPECFLDGP